ALHGLGHPHGGRSVGALHHRPQAAGQGHRRDRRGRGVADAAAGIEAQEGHRSEGGRGRHRQDGSHPAQVGVQVGHGIPARAGDRSEADGLWSGAGHRSGVVGDEAGAGGSARPEQAHRRLPVQRPDRRRQDG
ncbi:hypothetical protein LTR94_033740, partial [Friedmanniomyces endolithicus]